MDRPVAQRRLKRLVDEPVLLDERKPLEAAARDRHLEMVAATRAVLDGELARIGEGAAEKRLQRVGRGHGIIVAVARRGSFLVSQNAGPKLLLAGLAVLAALSLAPPARGSTPLPWCGIGPNGIASSEVDRVPDATPGFAVHVAYVRPRGAADRLAEWAPRIVGDVAAIDAWWRSQDPTRAPRFDLFPFACSSPFGQLDISSVTLPQPAGDIDTAFETLRFLLAEAHGFIQPEKAYLIYYDGAVEQPPLEAAICGAGDSPAGGLPGIAVVFLHSCFADEDVFRPVVAVHELVHVLGGVTGAAPNHCRQEHVCDDPSDLLNASLTGMALEAHVLDGGRDDYYGHSGTWADVQNSVFLERLDSPDRAPPSLPSGLTATDGAPGLIRVSWRAASDDVGPITYRVYQDGRFVASTTSRSALLGVSGESETSSYTVRASDTVGHLSQPLTVRFRLGLGVVDARGKLVRDTVRPPALASVSVRRTTKSIVLSWPAARDPGGLRNYRVRLGARTLFVKRPTVTLSLARLRTAVSLAAVDRAGNVGPATVVPLSRLR